MKQTLSQIRKIMRFDLLASFLSTRTVREKMYIMGFGLALLLTVDYFLWFSPVLKTLTRTIPIVSAVENDLQNMREDKKNAESIKKRYETISQELTLREKGLEAANQIPILLESLSKMASRTGVRITSLNPLEDQSAASGSKMYESLPIEIKATAGTHDLGAFLAILETGDMAFKVTNLKISQNMPSLKKQLIEMKVEAYRKI